MTKNSFYVAFISVVCAFVLLPSCKKHHHKQQFAFTIKQVEDQTYEGTTIVLPLEIDYTSGDQERVTMSISGLPSGMTGTFGSQAGTPTFNTTLTLTSSDTINAGTYTLEITGTSESGVTESTLIKLNVPENCRDLMTGKYLYRAISNGGVLYTTHYMATKANGIHSLLFTDISSNTPDFIIKLNCSNNTCYLGIDTLTKGTFTVFPRAINLPAAKGNITYTFTEE